MIFLNNASNDTETIKDIFQRDRGAKANGQNVRNTMQTDCTEKPVPVILCGVSLILATSEYEVNM